MIQLLITGDHLCDSIQVISKIRVLMNEDSNSAVSNSFLLDDDSRLALMNTGSLFFPSPSIPDNNDILENVWREICSQS